MKYIIKTALLALATISTFSYAKTGVYQACAEDVEGTGSKDCYSIQMSIPNYPYDWLNQFAINTSFEGFDYQSIEVINNAHSINSKVNWQPLGEGNGYLQLVQEEISASQGEGNTNQKFYYIFYKNKPLYLISLEDIINKNATKKLIQILKSSYIQWQMQNMGSSKKEATDIASRSLTYLPSNWWFEKNVIVFGYSESEIGPDSYGNVNLQVPVQKLTGIIKSDTLKAAEQWRTHAF